MLDCEFKLSLNGGSNFFILKDNFYWWFVLLAKINSRGIPVNSWYRHYFSQNWYKNTFLISEPKQIARVNNRHGEWNNLNDSGCHFTCISMIVGVDPARLASALSKEKFFKKDNDFSAKYLNGEVDGLVWDCNAPHEHSPSMHLSKFWHPFFNRRIEITVSFVTKSSVSNHESGCLLVRGIRDRGNHVVFGTSAHSLLVAGVLGDDFYIWDPDTTSEDGGTSEEDNVFAKYSLRSFFKKHPNEEVEFWEYKVVVNSDE